jgi:hypothetical protein
VEWFINSSRLKHQVYLDRGAVEALNPPQRGLGVTGKSSRPWDKFVSCVQLPLLLNFLLAIYFEQFTLLEIELYLITLGCKPSPSLELVEIGSPLCY